MLTTTAVRRPYVVAIIQARMNSARLPGKMMMDLGGHPLLWSVIQRTGLAQTVHQVVVATPDDVLYELAYDSGAWGFKDTGDPNNVLARYLNCAAWCDADIVVRITGDCPLIDPELIDKCVIGVAENRCDISTNVHKRTFPIGFDVEVLHRNVLKRLFHLTNDQRYREHVTLFAHEHPELFVWHDILDSVDRSLENYSVDTLDDLEEVRRFVHTIGSITFTYEDVVRWHDGLVRESFRSDSSTGG